MLMPQLLQVTMVASSLRGQVLSAGAQLLVETVTYFSATVLARYGGLGLLVAHSLVIVPGVESTGSLGEPNGTAVR